MMKKFIFLLVLFIIGGFALVGCGESSNDEDILKVALAIPGSKTDGGWSQVAYDGLLQIEDELGAEISINENTQAADYEKIFSNYAKDGNDIVIGHGFQFGDAALAIADDYPDTFFIITSSTVTNGTNVGSISNFNLQAGFLQGALAALMTETGTVGAIGGTQIPTIVKTVVGFELGAEYINPSINNLSAIIGSDNDANIAKEQALTFYNQGADVVMANANAAGRGVFVAAEEGGHYAIASIAAEYDKYPNGLLASTKVDMSISLLLVAEKIKEGEYEASAEMYGVKEGIVDLTYNPNLEETIPKEVKDEMDDIKDKLSSGEIDVLELAPEEYR